MNAPSHSAQHVARLHALLDVVESWAGLECAPQGLDGFEFEPDADAAREPGGAMTTPEADAQLTTNSHLAADESSSSPANSRGARDTAPIELAFRGPLQPRQRRARAETDSPSTGLAPSPLASERDAQRSTSQSRGVAETSRSVSSSTSGPTHPFTAPATRSSEPARSFGPSHSDRPAQQREPSLAGVDHRHRPASSFPAHGSPSLLAPLAWADQKTPSTNAQDASRHCATSDSTAPFDDLEERLAEVLERSALEAGIDLS